MIASTVGRVPGHTSQEINWLIEADLEARVHRYAAHPEEIDRRLRELDEEWDIERTLEANASTLAFTGTILGVTLDKRFLAVPAIVAAFLFQHAVQGWCPPLPILRRFGFRTMREIETERYALKTLRGDFGKIDGNAGHDNRASEALRAARR